MLSVVFVLARTETPVAALLLVVAARPIRSVSREAILVAGPAVTEVRLWADDPRALTETLLLRT